MHRAALMQLLGLTVAEMDVFNALRDSSSLDTESDDDMPDLTLPEEVGRASSSSSSTTSSLGQPGVGTFGTPSLAPVDSSLLTLDELFEDSSADDRKMKQFVETMSWICPICRGIPLDPCVTPVCAHLYCTRCIQTWVKTKSTCPVCQGSVSGNDIKSTSGALARRQMNELISFRCPLSGPGAGGDERCPWRGKLGDWREHIGAKCQYALVKCDQCKQADICRFQFPQHQEEQCPNRLIRCEHCLVRVPYQVWRATHGSECSHALVPCAHACGAVCKRLDIREHEHNTCPLRLVECPFECGWDRFPAREAHDHYGTQCSKSPRLCSAGMLCGKWSLTAMGTRTDRLGLLGSGDWIAHDRVCPHVPVPCSLCGDSVPRRAMEEHLEKDCSSALVTCPFGPFGCNPIPALRRCDLKTHEEQHRDEHLQLAYSAGSAMLIVHKHRSQVAAVRAPGSSIGHGPAEHLEQLAPYGGIGNDGVLTMVWPSPGTRPSRASPVREGKDSGTRNAQDAQDGGVTGVTNDGAFSVRDPNSFQSIQLAPSRPLWCMDGFCEGADVDWSHKRVAGLPFTAFPLRWIPSAAWASENKLMGQAVVFKCKTGLMVGRLIGFNAEHNSLNIMQSSGGDQKQEDDQKSTEGGMWVGAACRRIALFPRQEDFLTSNATGHLVSSSDRTATPPRTWTLDQVALARTCKPASSAEGGRVPVVFLQGPTMAFVELLAFSPRHATRRRFMWWPIDEKGMLRPSVQA